MLLSMKYLQVKDKPGNFCQIFIVPFQVTQEIGINAMKLDLPTSMSI